MTVTRKLRPAPDVPVPTRELVTLDGVTINVIGIGNEIMADDAVGLAILRELESEPIPGVNFIYGGTSGMEILPMVQDADYLLVLDGLKQGQPGDVEVLIGDQIPRLLQQQLSPHQVGLLDLLSAARLTGQEPANVAVVGITARDVEFRTSLSEEIKAAIPEAVQRARQLLEKWTAEATQHPPK
ncbi:HyaD/HybD family hydrogenase maturation endopeptidase [Corynebacterium sp. NML140438]|uniref:HyaD/HybD family hydrogenase maturation endopeptidase n=1 Tax=Corynebacterium sp. NML140438 TaxID=1906334 RepID=UPI0009F5D59C|nr:HyaD/HybD family hydrogenase maturation endopeptidase [Corynebacterium sp. NML140438]